MVDDMLAKIWRCLMSLGDLGMLGEVGGDVGKGGK